MQSHQTLVATPAFRLDRPNYRVRSDGVLGPFRLRCCWSRAVEQTDGAIGVRGTIVAFEVQACSQNPMARRRQGV